MTSWKERANVSGESSDEEARGWDIPRHKNDDEYSGTSLDDSSDEKLSITDPNLLSKLVYRRVQAVKGLLVKAIRVEREFHEELFTLQCKYQLRLQPLYLRRDEIVSGWYEPSQEDYQGLSSKEEKQSEIVSLGERLISKLRLTGQTPIVESNQQTVELGLPNFWLNVMKNAAFIADLVEPHDERVLTHLTDIRVFYSTAPMGFTLEFHFSENDYFRNSTLTKEYFLTTNPDPLDIFAYDGLGFVRAKGCVIDWHPHMNLTVKTTTKTLKSRGTSKAITKLIPTSSFFNFFKTHYVTDDDSQDDSVEQQLESDYEVGNFIKDRLIPRAILYYTREALDPEELTVEGCCGAAYPKKTEGGAAEPDRKRDAVVIEDEEDLAEGPCSPSDPDRAQQGKCKQQ